jgi:hypothetical protein
MLVDAELRPERENVGVASLTVLHRVYVYNDLQIRGLGLHLSCTPAVSVIQNVKARPI